MTTALLRAGARGGSVTLLAQAVRMIIQLGGVVILSRLLSPHDFGILAMVTVFMTLADLVRDFGMPTAALQAKSLTNQQASNLFWASFSLGIMACSILLAFTPAIVALYSEPKLAEVVPILAITLVISGAQAQIQVQLARRLRFNALATSSVAAPLLGLVAAIIVANNGGGYRALVAQAIATPVVLLVWQGLCARWVPTRPRKGHNSRHLLTSGVHFGAGYLLAWAASNVDSLVVGVKAGATSLGFYNRAFQLTASPVASFLSPLTQVAIPMLARGEREGKDPRTMLLRLQFAIAAPISALMITIILVAPALVPLVLGPQWTPMIPIMQILSAGECIHALSFVSYWGFLSTGLARHLLYYNLLTKPIGVALVLAGSTFGVPGVAVGYVAGMAISWPINIVWLARTAQFPAKDFLINGTELLVIAGVSYAILWLGLGPWIGTQSWGAAIVGAGASLILFSLLVLSTRSGRAGLRTLRSLFARVR